MPGFGRRFGGTFGGSQRQSAVVETIDCSGAALGGCTASAAVMVRKAVAATFTGASFSSAPGALTQLSSVTFRGSSSLDWDYRVEAAGLFAGGSALSAGARAARGATGVFIGSSYLIYSVILPIQGTSFFSVSAVINDQ